MTVTPDIPIDERNFVMSSAQPWRVADDLWLAAHDSVNGKARLGDWPLGVGLATGLIAELVACRSVDLRAGELFRTTAEPPDDPALRPVLMQMEAEEQSTPRQPARARAAVRARDDWDWPPRPPDDARWPPPAHEVETRHRRRGHDLGVWMSYLAHERRGETLVLDRLSRMGLVRRDERRRLLGGTTVSYVPFDSVVSGTPANTITSTVQSGQRLDPAQLLLAGLFLATGLHHHALATLTPAERSHLADELKRSLDDTTRELLRAADVAVGEAAMR